MGYQVLRFKLRCHRSFKKGTTSNQDIGANRKIQRRKIWSRTSVARGRREVTEQLLLCNGATQVSRTAPAERRNAKEALPRNHWHGCQCWLRSESWPNRTKRNQRKLQWYLHHLVINSHKAEKVRRVCNAAAKYQGVALNDKLLSGPDLPQSLIGIIFRFREHQIALSADIEAIFFQVRATTAYVDNFSGEKIQSREQMSMSTHDMFWAKILPTLHQVAKDNVVNDESIVRTVHRNFYMDDFLKSVRTPEEAIEIYQKVRDIHIKGRFNLTKWITSDEEVKSQIPEADRSTKVVKTFEAESQLSSILGLNWNVDTDSLIVSVVELSKKFQQN